MSGDRPIGMRNWALVLLALGLLAPAPTPADPLAEAQLEADTWYEEGRFRRAWDAYAELARIGDSFAQYRLSVMRLRGQGIDADPAEAFGWSVLAAQDGSPQLLAWSDAVWDDLAPHQRQPAADRAVEMMERWSNLALARRAHRDARRALRRCTGSRLGARCEDLSVYGGIRQERHVATEPSSPGVDDRDIIAVRQARAAMERLEDYVAEERGRVTIGELEVLEESVEER